MFHVPEPYRILDGPLGSTATQGNNGAFWLPSRMPGRELWIIASDIMGLEHVSVHAANAHPNTHFVPCCQEMCTVQAIFWDKEDVVMQWPPAQREYVHLHSCILHLWRPSDGLDIPRPPNILNMLVGLKGVTR